MQSIQLVNQLFVCIILFYFIILLFLFLCVSYFYLNVNVAVDHRWWYELVR